MNTLPTHVFAPVGVIAYVTVEFALDMFVKAEVGRACTIFPAPDVSPVTAFAKGFKGDHV